MMSSLNNVIWRGDFSFFGVGSYAFEYPLKSPPQTPGAEPVWAALVDDVRSGVSGSEQELIARLWPLVSRIALRLCPRRDCVEDLAQESFIKIFQKLDQWRGGAFEGWCGQIVRRVCYDALRRRKVRPEWTFAELGAEIDGEAVGNPEVTEAAEVLRVLFSRISPDAAWLLNEVELCERAIGEVSQEMGWTKTAGRLRLMRARRQLKAAYERLEGGK